MPRTLTLTLVANFRRWKLLRSDSKTPKLVRSKIYFSSMNRKSWDDSKILRLQQHVTFHVSYKAVLCLRLWAEGVEQKREQQFTYVYAQLSIWVECLLKRFFGEQSLKSYNQATHVSKDRRSVLTCAVKLCVHALTTRNNWFLLRPCYTWQ